MISAYFQNDLAIMLPELFLTTGILLLLMYGVVYNTSSTYGFPVVIKPISWLGILCLFITVLLLLNSDASNTVFMNGLLISDYVAKISKAAVLLSSMLVLFVSFEYFQKERIHSFEFVLLLLLGVLGMLFLISSYDFMSMYLAIELQSLCLYVLAAYKRNSLFSVEAGLKYFVLGAFSSGILLFGISILYGFTGVTSFGDLGTLIIDVTQAHLMYSSGVLLGIVCVCAGLFFKIYAVPFHVWVPDVYQGSPTIVTTFFAITPGIAVLTVIVRLFVVTLHNLISFWQPVFMFCAIASMLVGSIIALSQQRIKRLLAYSAIGHVGYILTALSAGTAEGVRGVLMYAIVYICMSACFFTVLLSLRKVNDNTQVVFINELRALYKTNPVLAATLSIALFSMAGIPPLAGFFSKLYVFLPAIHEGLFLLVFVGIVASVISAVYYLGIIKVMYFEKTEQYPHFESMDKEKALILAITTFILLFFFVFPSPLVLMSHKAALLICL